MTPPTLLVQEYLRAGGTRESLLTDHGVHMKQPRNGKVSFIYDQLEAKDDDPIAQECRGLILREGSWDIVAFPFRRFFNHGQGAAARIDWDSAQFEEKLDGTLLIVYFDHELGEWHCATRSACEAHLKYNGFAFRELADMAARDMGFGGLGNLFSIGGTDRTYMVELTAPENQIVCEYADRKLTLLGIRDLRTHKEINPMCDSMGHTLGVPRAWYFDNFEHLAEVIKTWHPKKYEGVVVKDRHFNRIKVKSPAYLAAHHAIDSLGSSWRAVVGAVASGAANDLDGIIPPFVQKRVDEARNRLRGLCAETREAYSRHAHIEDQKAFALAVKHERWPAALFALRNGKAETPEHFASRTLVNGLTQTLGLGDA